MPRSSSGSGSRSGSWCSCGGRASALRTRSPRRPRLAGSGSTTEGGEMAWGFISELPVSRDEYDRIDAEIGDDPEGLILHTASEKNGKMRIIDVWESKDAYERFENDVLMPAMSRLGGE